MSAGIALQSTRLPVINPALAVPVPQAIETLSYDILRGDWLAAFRPLFLARTGEDYDVGDLETDPGVIIAEAFSYLRINDRARINDVYRALRLALAEKGDLDGLGLDRGVRRLVYVPADEAAGTAAVTEPDESYRLRIWLKMQTWGLGSPYGVEYLARTRGLAAIADARCYDFPGEGRMRLVLLQPAGFAGDFSAVLADVGGYVMARHRRPGAVWIDTVAAERPKVDVVGTLYHRRGASPDTVRVAAETAVTAYMAKRRRIGALVSSERIDAAVCVADVVDAEISPKADVAVGAGAAAELGRLVLKPEAVDD